ncbi:hypothetical protein [Paraburkholderia sp. D1E]|uniref:hypothetical protein n=1 Tax=Paraburkholderia sp. D1E TaxID=3461398 RepID=UPI0040463B9A
MNSYEHQMTQHPRPRVREESRDEFWNRRDEQRQHQQHEQRAVRQDEIRHRDRVQPRLLGPFDHDVAPALLSVDDTAWALVTLARRDGRAYFHAPGLVVEVSTASKHALDLCWTVNRKESSEYDFRQALQAARSARKA